MTLQDCVKLIENTKKEQVVKEKVYNKQYILEHAELIEFPTKREGKLTYLESKAHKLPDIDMMFGNYRLNNHHYSSQYHFKYVLPLLNELFNINMNLSDFIMNENFVNNGQHDLSYLTPIKDKQFTVESWTYDVEPISGNYDILMHRQFPNHLIQENTDYHYLYCLPHTMSCITNHSQSNNKTILIMGDSQFIPDVPVLAYYYKHVIYIDNRFNKKWLHKISQYDIDDILIQLYDKKLNFYFKYLQ